MSSAGLFPAFLTPSPVNRENLPLSSFETLKNSFVWNRPSPPSLTPLLLRLENVHCWHLSSKLEFKKKSDYLQKCTNVIWILFFYNISNLQPDRFIQSKRNPEQFIAVGSLSPIAHSFIHMQATLILHQFVLAGSKKFRNTIDGLQYLSISFATKLRNL